MINLNKLERLSQGLHNAAKELIECNNEYRKVMLRQILQYRHYKLTSYIKHHEGKS